MTGERPNGACVTHLPPKQGRRWREASAGKLICGDCRDRMTRMLSPIAVDDDGRPEGIPGLFTLLNPRPGNNTDRGRRAPGFGSRSPANDFVISQRDCRTVHVKPGDPHSVLGLLDEWARLVADALNVKGLPIKTAIDLCRFLSDRLDWITRQEFVISFDAELRTLVSQMRDLGPRVPIGDCPNTIQIDADRTRECGAKLFAPLQWREDTVIKCWAEGCGREWPRESWPGLGALLTSGKPA